MQKRMKIDGQLRAMALALGGAALTSVIAMFIPVALFESITGSTGISELVPAMGAPLGDTARALISFGFGALAFAVLTVLLMRKPARAQATPSAPVAAETARTATASAGSFVDRMRSKAEAFFESRRQAVVVKDLSDLPKLRAGDAHPDAPPRRPISAHRDFAEIIPEPVPVADDAADTAEEPAAAVPSVAETVATASPVAITEPADSETAAEFEAPVAPPPAHADLAEADVAAMVDRLEQAVARREAQLAKLEDLAGTPLAAPTSGPEAAAISLPNAPETPEAPEAPLAFMPVLEAVPSEPAPAKGAAEMDAALRSALETLHRMNARTR